MTDVLDAYRYRGRHRRPTTAGRTATRLAVVGVAMTPSVLGASSAWAVPDEGWDRLAACESSGDWRADTGNGFFGGVQFTASTWRQFGGGQFADRADRATPAQQKVVAERTLAGQGWNAWPVCSRKTAVRGYVPDVTRSGGSRDSAGDDRRPPTYTTGERPRVHAAPGTTRHRTHPPRVRRDVSTVRVERGDTLSGIAAEHGTTWPRVYRANRGQLTAGPDVLRIGQRLVLR